MTIVFANQKKQRHVSACRYFMLQLTVSMLCMEKNRGDNAAVSGGFICFVHFSLLSVSRV